MCTDCPTLTVRLGDARATALAEFCKRAGFSTYRELAVGQSVLTDGDVSLLESVLSTLSNIAKKQTLKAHHNYAARYESRFKKATINDASRSAEFLLSDFSALVAKVQDIVRAGG